MSRNEAAREVLQPKSRRVKARTVCVQALCGPRIQHGWPPLPQIGERDLRALCAGRAPGCERRGGAGGTARQSRHGSRIRNAIRTNVATSPASAFLSQVAQICNASADRQADIFRHRRSRVLKGMEWETPILKCRSQQCEETHLRHVPTHEEFSFRR